MSVCQNRFYQSDGFRCCSVSSNNSSLQRNSQIRFQGNVVKENRIRESAMSLYLSNTTPGKVDYRVRWLCTSISEMIISNLRYCRCPYIFWDNISVRPRPLPCKSYPIHYTPAIPPSNPTYPRPENKSRQTPLPSMLQGLWTQLSRPATYCGPI
jgi:hypothetical protein